MIYSYIEDYIYNNKQHQQKVSLIKSKKIYEPVLFSGRFNKGKTARKS